MGDSFVPVSGYWAKRCDALFVVGEAYQLEMRSDRSEASHRAYFAAIHECWINLPEHMLEQFPTSEHLRKFALIRSGYRDERSIVCSSAAEAKQVAGFVKPMDDFAVVSSDGPLVTVWTAKSQSYRAMPKGEFQASKQAVLDYLAGMIGTTPRALVDNAATVA
jgi:hypothetical protein